MSNRENLKMKKITTYIEDDYQTAYAKARRELGPNLIIVEKKDIKVGGFLGIMSKNKVKVTYGVEDRINQQNKNFKSKNDNKDILDLLEKMGFDNNNNNNENRDEKIVKTFEDDGVTVEINGVYNPYQNQIKSKKRTFEGNKKTLNKSNEEFKEVLKNSENINLENIENKKNEKQDINMGTNDIEYIKNSIKEELKKEMFGKKIEEKSFLEEDEIVEILKENEVDKKLAQTIKKYLEENQYNEKNYSEGIKKYFLENIKVTDSGFKSKFVMFIGPTGVGKTTTAAKIVANRWREEHDVGFITADTYRLEAVSQLKAYANIMRVPVEVIKKPEELSYAVEKFKDKDFVIIDTAGRSPKNSEQMEELKGYIKSIGVDIEVCLVLSATAKLSVMYETIEKFSYIGFSSIIFTKIDETTTTGSILSVCNKYNLPVSYITTGQKVPGDVEVATKDRVTEIFFKELI
jgi:flagellar biosynthesis protein FlhF